MSFNDRDGAYTIQFQDGRIKLLDCTGAEVQPGTARTIARILFDQNQIDTCVYIGKTPDKLKVMCGEDALRMKPERDNLTGQAIEQLVKIKCRGRSEATQLEASIHNFLTHLGRQTFRREWYVYMQSDAEVLINVLQTHDPVHAHEFFEFALKEYTELYQMKMTSPAPKLELLERITNIKNTALRRHAYAYFKYT
ncbi:MAG: hypothetical protein J0M07_21035 [Anaerolineae bacterium]|nr:hypothetical protein [Anaerolineae bacterium]